MRTDGTSQRMTDYEDHMEQLDVEWNWEEAGGQETVPGVRTEGERRGVNTQQVRAEEAGRVE